LLCRKEPQSTNETWDVEYETDTDDRDWSLTSHKSRLRISVSHICLSVRYCAPNSL